MNVFGRTIGVDEKRDNTSQLPYTPSTLLVSEIEINLTQKRHGGRGGREQTRIVSNLDGSRRASDDDVVPALVRVRPHHDLRLALLHESVDRHAHLSDELRRNVLREEREKQKNKAAEGT